MINPKERLFLALDVKNIEEATLLLNKLEGKIELVKVNSLTVSCPEIISLIQERKMKVWRDLKHHDIPGTVSSFIKADIKAGVVMTTIHSLGGIKMMQYAVEAAKGSNLKILGITILTSHNQKGFNQEIGIPGLVRHKVVQLALMAERAGLSGVVASAKEAKILRANLKPETLIVTPGIKPIWAVKREDQSRVTTPYDAILDGADYLVVGSAIRTNQNPGEAVDKIIAEMKRAFEDRESLGE